MHMANELLSIPVAAMTLVLGALVTAAAALRARKTLNPERLPLMGVMGAFVFAGQMINFTLPGMPGTSGHLGGGVLLAIILGPSAGIVTLAAILIVQCLIFQDGGLLALGTNIMNMGVVPCLLGWGLYRLILGPAERAKPWRQYLATWLACVVGVTGGAALVPLEAALSGVLRIPMTQFLAVMVAVHLVIGFFEGLVTFVVVAYLRQIRPAVLGLPSAESGGGKLSRFAVTASFLVTALLLAGVIAWFASSYPDGLEWSYLEHRYTSGEKALGEPPGIVSGVDAWQAKWSLLPDYTKRSAPLGQTPVETDGAQDASAEGGSVVKAWTSLAGIVGTIVTLAIVYLAAVLLRRRGRIVPEH
jgi:cobalt/nickel transport system permease protein